MNLSPNMLAALRFFAGNVTEQTQTADRLLNTTVAALWRRELLAVNTDGIIIPNAAGFAALGEPAPAVETAEQEASQGLDSAPAASLIGDSQAKRKDEVDARQWAKSVFAYVTNRKKVTRQSSSENAAPSHEDQC